MGGRRERVAIAAVTAAFTASVSCGRREFDDQNALVELAAHGHHSCAITVVGDLWCWGRNQVGQLGGGDIVGGGRVPRPVELPRSPATIATAEYGSCAVLDDGVPWCWGDNSNGALGTGGPLGPVAEPAPVIGVTAPGELAGGEWHWCAVRDDGAVACWGTDTCDQLGNGAGSSASLTPMVVAGTSNRRGVATNDSMSCSVDNAGAVTCWGAWYTVFQDPSWICGPAMSPAPATVALPAPVAQLEGGCHAHVCALLDDGSVWCWGDNAQGQLGDGTMVNQTLPVRVAGLGPPGPAVREIAVGAYFSCARVDDGVYCWGQNTDGQLGLSSFTPRELVPRRVTGLDGLTIDDLDAGCFHACARVGTDLYCWGDNSHLQMADGTTADRPSPARVQIYNGFR